MKTNALLSAQAGFIVLTAIYFVLLLKNVFQGVSNTGWEPRRKQNFKRNWVIVLLLWAIFVSAWSASGMMRDFSLFPFNFLPVIAIPLITSLVITFSAPMGEVLDQINKEKIIQLQSFRFFVEILLWLLFVANLLPVQMTFEGRNFDILAGVSGPVIAWLAMRGKISRTGLILWNIICLGLLTNIVSIAILSTPAPIRVFMNEPANTIVTEFPVSWLPGFLVPLAYTLHFFSLRQLVRSHQTAPSGIRS
jgi:hypothetical protein